MLADEPTGILDSQSCLEIMGLLQMLNREQGLTVIVVPHELDIANHTQRIVSMLDGVVVSDQRVEKPLQANVSVNTVVSDSA